METLNIQGKPVYVVPRPSAVAPLPVKQEAGAHQVIQEADAKPSHEGYQEMIFELKVSQMLTAKHSYEGH